MSIRVMTWVWEHSEAQNGARLTLLALADYAHDDGSKAFPAIETLMGKTRLSKRAVQNALKKLVDDGMIEQRGQTSTGTNVYTVVMRPVAQILHPADSASGDADSAPDPSLTRHSLGSSSQGQLDLVGGAPATPAPSSFPVKAVGGKKVTEAEKALSRAIVATFNAKFGTDYRGREHYIDVVGRIRERPELTLEDHAAIIERFSHTTWWKRTRGGRTVSRPSVSHVYGSGKALDAAAQAKPQDGSDDGPDLSYLDRMGRQR